MKFSIYQAASEVGSVLAGKAKPKKILGLCAFALAGFGVSVTQADATFSYELSAADDKNSVKQFSIARFFVRIDDPDEEKRFLLFQAGRFFPVYAVNEAESNYRLLTPPETPWLGPNTRAKQRAEGKTVKNDSQADAESADEVTQQQAAGAQTHTLDSTGAKPKVAAAEPTEPADSAAIKQAPALPASATQPGPDVAKPDAPPVALADSAASAAPPAKPSGRLPPPKLKATKKMRTVAGIRCRVVHELRDGEPVMEHCMANSAALGVTKREVITLSRLFSKARTMEFDWLGTGTKDEEFVAIQSRSLGDNRLLQLTSVSTKPLPAGHLRIPKSFKLVEPDVQSGAKSTGKAD